MSLPTFAQNTFLASGCVSNIKPAPKAEAPGQASSFSLQKDCSVCSGGRCLPRAVSPIVVVPWVQRTQPSLWPPWLLLILNKTPNSLHHLHSEVPLPGTLIFWIFLRPALSPRSGLYAPQRGLQDHPHHPLSRPRSVFLLSTCHHPLSVYLFICSMSPAHPDPTPR